MSMSMGVLRAAWLVGICMLAACHSATPATPLQSAAPLHAPVQAGAISGSRTVVEKEAPPPLVAAARQQIGVTLVYDPAYVPLAYPGGDVPMDRGVCTDVVVRALRTQGLDLQHALHDDMAKHFADYPQLWGLPAPNANIDHRRVPNQMHWFQQQGWAQPVTANASAYLPGDIVAWKLNSGPLHIGIVSDRLAADGTPLVIHNIGNGTQEDDILFGHSIIGHYRPAGL